MKRLLIAALRLTRAPRREAAKWQGFAASPFRFAVLYARYLKDWRHYSLMPGAGPMRWADRHPCLYDRTPFTPVDPFYFYQDVWAFERIRKSGARWHVDVGSRAILAGILSKITRVTFVDIRPLNVSLDNLEMKQGSILSLPFEDASIPSLSCLSVAEHIGLGRYGDPLDPLGAEKAAMELTRVLAIGGTLYLSVPIGKPRVCFNAHRIFSPPQILEIFHDLDQVRFCGIDSGGRFRGDALPNEFANEQYGVGLFEFVKSGRPAK